MNEIIITILITAGILLICGGIGLGLFVDWLENNQEDQ